MSKLHILEGVDYGRDLYAKMPNSDNFTYGEFVSSEMAVRHNVANIPSEADWVNLEHLVEDILQPLRTTLGESLTINSGYRCKILNDLVGSSDTSYHRKAAADVDSATIPLMKILEEASKLPVSELIAEYFPNGWVHIGYMRGQVPPKLIKLKDSSHNYTKLSLSEIKSIYKGK